MPSPRYCIQRAPPPSPAALLREILQWGPHASIPGERRTGLARRRSRRAHSLSPNLGRTASPICPDLIYDRHSLGLVLPKVGVQLFPQKQRNFTFIDNTRQNENPFFFKFTQQARI